MSPLLFVCTTETEPAVPSRKHPYHLNGNLCFLFLSQLISASLYWIRDALRDRFSIRWSNQENVGPMAHAGFISTNLRLLATGSAIPFPDVPSGLHCFALGDFHCLLADLVRRIALHYTACLVSAPVYTFSHTVSGSLRVRRVGQD